MPRAKQSETPKIEQGNIPEMEQSEMPEMEQGDDVQVESNGAHSAHGPDDQPTENAAETPAAGWRGRDVAVATAATVGVVAVGTVFIEAALIPGLALGVVAAIAPQLLPRTGAALHPLFRSTVRGVYKLGHHSRKVAAGAHEHFNDIIAEARADSGVKAATKQAAEAAAI